MFQALIVEYTILIGTSLQTPVAQTAAVEIPFIHWPPLKQVFYKIKSF